MSDSAPIPGQLGPGPYVFLGYSGEKQIWVVLQGSDSLGIPAYTIMEGVVFSRTMRAKDEDITPEMRALASWHQIVGTKV